MAARPPFFQGVRRRRTTPSGGETCRAGPMSRMMNDRTNTGFERRHTDGAKAIVQSRTSAVPFRAAVGAAAPGGAVALPRVQEHARRGDHRQDAQAGGRGLESILAGGADIPVGPTAGKNACPTKYSDSLLMGNRTQEMTGTSSTTQRKEALTFAASDCLLRRAYSAEAASAAKAGSSLGCEGWMGFAVSLVKGGLR